MTDRAPGSVGIRKGDFGPARVISDGRLCYYAADSDDRESAYVYFGIPWRSERHRLAHADLEPVESTPLLDGMDRVFAAKLACIVRRRRP